VVENKTKREIVYRALRKEINSGHMMPGTRLIELDLAERHAVSRTIIREVMKQLAAEGLVDLIPYKGATVARISIKDLMEIYRIHQDLEGLAAYLATGRLTEKQIAELEKIHKASENHASDDVAGWQKWNARFHRALIDNCGNQQLIKLLTTHEIQFARYWFLLLSIPGRIETSIKEHAEILSAIKAGDADQVREVMERHFESSSSKLFDIVSNIYPISFNR
jgi:DNA-binding GntR family transcriptional regulator